MVLELIKAGADLRIRNKQNMGVIEVATEEHAALDTASVNSVLDVLLETDEKLRTMVVYHQDCEDPQVF